MPDNLNRLEARVQRLVLRNDLLNCPADLHLPMVCACIGVASPEDAGMTGVGPREAQEAWFEMVDAAIDEVGELVSEARLERITECAARLGWSDPRPEMTANVGMRM